MMSVSRFALAAALTLGASAVLAPAPADAQRAPRGQQARPRAPQIQIQGRTLNISAQERTALLAVDAAVAGTDAAAQNAALAAARPLMQSADARYAFSRYEMRVAIARHDNAMLSHAVDMALESGMATPEELPTFLSSQATLAAQAGDHAKAERALARLAQLRPNDVDTQIQLAQLRVNQGHVADGLRTLQAAITARQQAGQAAPESWHRFGTATAYASRDAAVRAQAIPFARGMVTAYPTAVNWRDALSILREVGNLDAAAQLDVFRLALAAGALAGERDYYDFANTLNSGGYPAEAKAVLDAGVSRHMVDPARSPFRELLQTASSRLAADRADLPNSQRAALAAATGTPALRTGDAFLGYARYPEAIALYQAALQKGGVDANLVNTRLGIAYALSGQRPAAEAAFRTITGPRAEIASFWLLWLSQRPGS